MKSLTRNINTASRKPKLYDLLIAAVVFEAATAIALFCGAWDHPAWATGMQLVFLFYTLARLIAAFVGQIRYNLYSYNTIYYTGFSAFVIYLIVAFILLLIHQVRDPETYTAAQSLYILATSAENYVLLTFPLMAVFSVALCVSNVVLIRREGRRLANLLGILLSALIVAGTTFLFRFDYSFSGSFTEVLIHDIAAAVLSAVYLYFECMLIGTAFAAALAAEHEPRFDKEFVIILGCGLRPDGTPTPLLAGRIDRALRFRREQIAATGLAPVLVASGGRGPDEAVAEGEAIRRYIVEHGVPAEQVIVEDASATTFENLSFSRDKILAARPGFDGEVAFSTTRYHVFRGGLFARRVKLRAVGMGARTRWYFWPNAWVREFVGLLTAHRGKQAIILSALIVVYTLTTYFSMTV